jgi:hypothetical protein
MFTICKNPIFQLHALLLKKKSRKHSKNLYKNNVIFTMNYHK